jgi:Stigma-specific protein, Stig1
MRLALLCSLVCFFLALAALGVSGCKQSTTQQQCMTMGGPSDLVSQAALFRLDVYPDTIMCEGGDVPSGSVPTLTRTFKPGDAIKLDIPPGHQTLVLTTFADDAGTIEMGSGCTTTDLKPGSQVCINLTILPAPDIAVVTDLSTIDVAACSGSDCPCAKSPDNCPSGQFCGQGMMCQLGCKTSNDCNGMGPAVDGGLPLTTCNTTTHQCAECNDSSTCPLGKLCSPSGSCVIGCDSTHACPGGLTCCSSLCVDTTTDPLNCGACGSPCNAGGNTTCCASTCSNITNSPDNCGSCGHVCSSAGVKTRSCTTGACTPTCSFGNGDCNAAVKNPPNDGCETPVNTPQHCGTCTIACADNATGHATGSVCNLPDAGASSCSYSCSPNFDDCDKNTAPDTNGCEASLLSDKLNCGACNSVCDTTTNSNTQCTGGGCTGTCNTNLCDATQASHNDDECETPANTVTHCGTCAACLPTSTFVTAHSCQAGTPNTCAYTCTCSTSNNSSRSCDGTTCAFMCNTGFADCVADNAGHSDGCECPSAGTASQGTVGGCCPSTPNKCQNAHTTGIGSEFYYDCVSLGTYNQAQAMKACTAHTGDATKCTPIDCGTHPSTIIAVRDATDGKGNCQTWAFASGNGTVGGTVFDGTDASCTGSGCGCFCPGTGWQAWQ